MLGLFISLFDHRQFIRVQVIVRLLLLFVVLVLVLVEEELRVEDDLALELIVAIFKYEVKDLVVLVEDLVQDLNLEAGFEDLEDLSMLDLHGIEAEFHGVETADTL